MTLWRCVSSQRTPAPADCQRQFLTGRSYGTGMMAPSGEATWKSTTLSCCRLLEAQVNDLPERLHESLNFPIIFTQRFSTALLAFRRQTGASPGFVVRRGNDGNYVIGHSHGPVDFGAGYSSCSMTDSFVTNAVLIERAVSCWHLHQLISQTTQYLDSWLSDLVQSKLKMKLLEVEGARAPVSHSWQRHCKQT